MSNNQRYDFSSWDEFKEFDSSQSERTKSVSLRLKIDILTTDSSLESYTVQVSAQNVTRGMGVYIGPIAVQSLENAGIPPVPIHVSVEYSNFILGKNIISSIDEWEKSLPTTEKPVLDFLQKHSSKIQNILELVVLISGIFFCRAVLNSETLAADPGQFGKWLVVSAAIVVTFFYFGRTVSTLTERHIDRIEVPSIINFTLGDRNRDDQLSHKNLRTSYKALAFASTCVLQVILSVLANPIWEKVRSLLG